MILTTTINGKMYYVLGATAAKAAGCELGRLEDAFVLVPKAKMESLLKDPAFVKNFAKGMGVNYAQLWAELETKYGLEFPREL